MMKKLAFATMLVGLTLAGTADAHAWSRSRTVTGWRGTAGLAASGHCGGGSCSRQITRTGPQGKTLSRTGSVACSGGLCTGNRVTTLPNGTVVTREGTLPR